jgi:hypothetical protein
MTHPSVTIICQERRALSAMVRAITLLPGKHRRRNTLPDFDALQAMLLRDALTGCEADETYRELLWKTSAHCRTPAVSARRSRPSRVQRCRRSRPPHGMPPGRKSP